MKKKDFSLKKLYYFHQLRSFSKNVLDLWQRNFGIVVKKEFYLPAGTFLKKLLIKKEHFLQGFWFFSKESGRLARSFWQDCQICNLLFRWNFFRLCKVLEKTQLTLSFSNFQPKDFGLLLLFFGRSVITGIWESRGTFRGKTKFCEKVFSSFWDVLQKIFGRTFKTPFYVFSGNFWVEFLWKFLFIISSHWADKNFTFSWIFATVAKTAFYVPRDKFRRQKCFLRRKSKFCISFGLSAKKSLGL